MTGNLKIPDAAKEILQPERLPESVRELQLRSCLFFREFVCPWAVEGPFQDGRIPRRNSPGDFIAIPAHVRSWELSRFKMSARLTHALEAMGCTSMGDLHGLRVSDFGIRRNVGRVTQWELIQIIQKMQEDYWCLWKNPDAAGGEDYYEI